MLERKILENVALPLNSQFKHVLIEQNELKKFIKIFSAVAEKTPELVWGEVQRTELAGVLERQIENIDISFSDVILNSFDYSGNLEELRVEGVFVKHFNSDIYFKPSNPELFANALFIELKDRVEGDRYIGDQRIFEEVCEITNAVRNLIKYSKINNSTASNVSLYSLMLMPTNVSNERLPTLKMIVFNILKMISENQ